MFVRSFLTFSLALMASLAHAQQAEPDQKALFGGYLNSPAYKAFLEGIFNMGEPAILKAECPAMKIVEYNQYIMLEQPKFVRAGANFNIDTGSWVAVATLDRCGSQVRRRALLKATPGANQFQPTFLLPGNFRGDLKLEYDAIRIVGPGLLAFAKCEDRSKLQVLDVTAITPASPSGWSETWTAVACNTKIDAEVTYAATGNGMNISAGKWKVH